MRTIGNCFDFYLQIEDLTLHRCKIGDDEIKALSSCVGNIKGLFIHTLRWINTDGSRELDYGSEFTGQLTLSGITTLSRAVLNLPKPVSWW